MKKATLLLLFAAAVASADTKIATVDMDLVVLSHPKTEDNREEVAKLEEKAAEERNQTLGELTALEAQIKECIEKAQKPTLSDAERAEARAEAQKLRAQGQQKLEAARRTEAETAEKIRREALDRFADVKKDVDEKIAALAAEKGYDLILDSAAMRSGLPLPLVVWSNKAIDLTDDVIAAVGGDRKAAEEALEKGAARVFPGAGADAPAADSEAPAAR
ncbi:MAG: OmpH family outer membrane protein [Kiritimatiellae bacterium]|nr:OmpH family outer membrane protein [Kiritimatiellia bacterium]